MPRDVDAIARATNGQVVQLKKGDDGLMRLFSSVGAGSSIEKNKWTTEEEFDTYIDIARNGEKEGDRLKAVGMMSKRGREIAELNGQIVKGTQTEVMSQGDGTTVTLQATAYRLADNMQRTNNDSNEARLQRRIIPPIETDPAGVGAPVEAQRLGPDAGRDDHDSGHGPATGEPGDREQGPVRPGHSPDTSGGRGDATACVGADGPYVPPRDDWPFSGGSDGGVDEDGGVRPAVEEGK